MVLSILYATIAQNMVKTFIDNLASSYHICKWKSEKYAKHKILWEQNAETIFPFFLTKQKSTAGESYYYFNNSKQQSKLILSIVRIIKYQIILNNQAIII